MSKITSEKNNISYIIARHLPKRLLYWAFITVLAHSTTGKYGDTVVPELTAMEALDRFMKDYEL